MIAGWIAHAVCLGAATGAFIWFGAIVRDRPQDEPDTAETLRVKPITLDALASAGARG